MLYLLVLMLAVVGRACAAPTTVPDATSGVLSSLHGDLSLYEDLPEPVQCLQRLESSVLVDGVVFPRVEGDYNWTDPNSGIVYIVQYSKDEAGDHCNITSVLRVAIVSNMKESYCYFVDTVSEESKLLFEYDSCQRIFGEPLHAGFPCIGGRTGLACLEEIFTVPGEQTPVRPSNKGRAKG